MESKMSDEERMFWGCTDGFDMFEVVYPSVPLDQLQVRNVAKYEPASVAQLLKLPVSRSEHDKVITVYRTTWNTEPVPVTDEMWGSSGVDVGNVYKTFEWSSGGSGGGGDVLSLRIRGTDLHQFKAVFLAESATKTEKTRLSALGCLTWFVNDAPIWSSDGIRGHVSAFPIFPELCSMTIFTIEVQRHKGVPDAEWKDLAQSGVRIVGSCSKHELSPSSARVISKNSPLFGYEHGRFCIINMFDEKKPVPSMIPVPRIVRREAKVALYIM